MLVAHGGARSGVTETAHELGESRASLGGEDAAGVAEVVSAEIRAAGLLPSRVRSPEVDGIYLVDDERDADWFAEVVNNTGGAVDVWTVDGVDADRLVPDGSGYSYLPDRVDRHRIALLKTLDRPEILL